MSSGIPLPCHGAGTHAGATPHKSVLEPSHFAFIRLMIVAEKVEDAVNQKSAHFPLQRRIPLPSVSARHLRRDDNVSQERLSIQRFSRIAKGQNIGRIVLAAESPV